MPSKRDKATEVAMSLWFAAIWFFPGVGVAMAIAILTGAYDAIADDGIAPGEVQWIWWHIGVQVTIALLVTGFLISRATRNASKTVPLEAILGLLAEFVVVAIFNLCKLLA